MTNYLEIGLLSTYVLNVWKFRHSLEISAIMTHGVTHESATK